MFHRCLLPAVALTLGAGLASAQEPRQVLVVARKTPLVRFIPSGAEELVTLQPGDLLRETPTTGKAASALRYATLIDRRKEPLVGWVDSRSCYAWGGAPVKLPPPSPSIDPSEYPPALPALVRREPERVQQAFRDVEATIAANKKLKKEVPEPYFLRARLWGMVRNYDAALRDYVTASSLVKESKADPTRYAAYFDGMTRLLDGLDRVPKSPDPGTAVYHYTQARTAFYEGRDDRALRYLDDAISLDPGEPLYWYYRGLLYKRRGDERRAAHDARFGAHMERLNRKEGKSSDYLLTALERVQGPARAWLSKIRKGDHEAR